MNFPSPFAPSVGGLRRMKNTPSYFGLFTPSGSALKTVIEFSNFPLLNDQLCFSQQHGLVTDCTHESQSFIKTGFQSIGTRGININIETVSTLTR